MSFSFVLFSLTLSIGSSFARLCHHFRVL